MCYALQFDISLCPCKSNSPHGILGEFGVHVPVFFQEYVQLQVGIIVMGWEIVGDDSRWYPQASQNCRKEGWATIKQIAKIYKHRVSNPFSKGTFFLTNMDTLFSGVQSQKGPVVKDQRSRQKPFWGLVGAKWYQWEWNPSNRVPVV